MTCPQCGQRRGKRACPALGQTICPVCCATKRLVEIRCPTDCSYLVASKAHPSATVKRRQEGDLRTLLDGMGQLSEPQLQLFFLIQSYFLRPVPGAPRPMDAEVADAAGAVAATLETASRGVIFEHQASTAGGRRMAADLLGVLREAGRGGGSRFERESAEVLRGIERAARPSPLAEPGQRTYLDLVTRVLRQAAPGEAPVDPPSLILP
jgi:hypothetical protein